MEKSGIVLKTNYCLGKWKELIVQRRMNSSEVNNFWYRMKELAVVCLCVYVVFMYVWMYYVCMYVYSYMSVFISQSSLYHVFYICFYHLSIIYIFYLFIIYYLDHLLSINFLLYILFTIWLYHLSTYLLIYLILQQHALLVICFPKGLRSSGLMMLSVPTL